ncbi:DHA2 family efflux MFS transporter permease subunit [Streptomyces sp. NPDC006552]|uniref:DHA2 family efflux MFS transporter permease subunit n=1 Tax=Streptomyces sp. NPDC006552 TaxID=3157179 RepID=UPI0033A03FA2
MRTRAERPGTAGAEAGGAAPSRWVVLGLLLGIVLGTLDGTVVGTALPVIVRDLGGLAQLSWVVTAYLLTAAVSTPLWGKAGDLYGHKGSFLASIAVFLAGSVLCGAAQDMTQLIACRALQGIGAGGLLVGALALLGTLLTPAEAGRSQSLIGVLLPVAMVGGPLTGGFLTDQLNWRWVFYVNLPVGALALALVATGVRGRAERVRARPDLAGAALLTAAILALTLLASWAGTRYAWTSPRILGLALVSAGALTAFVRTERRAVEPVIPPRLFRDRNFTLAQVLSFVSGAALLAAAAYLPQYMQLVRGTSATRSGLLLLPLMLGMIAAQLLIGRRVAAGGRYRHYPVVGGALALAGALALLLLGTGTAAWAASALTLPLGAGLGCLLQPALLLTMNSAEPRDIGAAGGTQTLLRTVGGSLGVAVLGSVFAGRVREGTRPAAFRASVVDGLHGVALGVAALCAVAFAVAWAVREAPLRSRAAPARQE